MHHSFYAKCGFLATTTRKLQVWFYMCKLFDYLSIFSTNISIHFLNICIFFLHFSYRHTNTCSCLKVDILVTKFFSQMFTCDATCIQIQKLEWEENLFWCKWFWGGSGFKFWYEGFSSFSFFKLVLIVMFCLCFYQPFTFKMLRWNNFVFIFICVSRIYVLDA